MVSVAWAISTPNLVRQIGASPNVAKQHFNPIGIPNLESAANINRLPPSQNSKHVTLRKTLNHDCPLAFDSVKNKKLTIAVNRQFHRAIRFKKLTIRHSHGLNLTPCFHVANGCKKALFLRLESDAKTVLIHNS